jgi:hypothetical protein
MSEISQKYFPTFYLKCFDKIQSSKIVGNMVCDIKKIELFKRKRTDNTNLDASMNNPVREGGGVLGLPASFYR